MKLTLPDALHARPANLLVRVANGFVAEIAIAKGAKRANAKSILEVLALAAAKGDTIKIEARGGDADLAVLALATLIERNFTADLVPETGAVAVEGVAIGRARVLSDDPSSDRASDAVSPAERFAGARRDLDRDIARLSVGERELLEPERAILAELEPRVCAQVRAGLSFHDAVTLETAHNVTDLFLDARARLLNLVGHADLGAIDDDTILVAPSLPPSLVASLPPRVVGIVSAVLESDAHHGTGNTSHAAILARSRGIPLAFVGAEVTDSIQDGDRVILDTTESPARVWIAPSDSLASAMIEKRDARAKERTAEIERTHVFAATSLVIVRVNVSHAEEIVPEHARGVGLVRTELVFASHRARPSTETQVASYRSIVSHAKGHPVSIRLFDAGGDKPLAWLHASDANARGVALLFLHEAVLRDQLAAIGDARSAGDARALIPLTRGAEDVRRVRAMCPAGLRVGAMIETKDAADRADEIAAEADYVSIGTNDLTASVLGVPRADSGRGLETSVWAAISRIVGASRARGREVTVCGELAAHPEGAPRLVELGVHALSVAIPAFSRVIALVARKAEGEAAS